MAVEQRPATGEASVTRQRVRPTGWLARADLTYQEWLGVGARLGMAGRNAAWWIGDWIRFGEIHYGGRYAAAARVTGYEPQTLMNMAYVAARFKISRRRETLSWSHHAEVAALDTATQDHWLDAAAARGLTIRAFRRELQASRGARAPDARAVALLPDAEPALECPRCGYHFPR